MYPGYNGYYFDYVECNPIQQERGQLFAPPISYNYGPYTAVIPLILGNETMNAAPPIPQAVPGGIHVTAQRNGADVFIGDVVGPNLNYAAMKAPAIPTTGGAC